MSYTLTIESPEKAAWFEEQRSKLSPERLGALFVAFLKQQGNRIDDFDDCDFMHTRSAILSVAGGWQDDRTEDEIIADIEAHRTPGREVVL